MKAKIITYCCLLINLMYASAQGSPFGEPLLHYIENPAIFEENQEEGRAYFIPEKHLSLNGVWKFHYSDTPENLPEGFFEINFNDKKWPPINVPSNWEMQGFGDKMFRGVTSPFKPNPPYVPKDYNPTGIYRRTFSVPSDWKGEQVFLRFEKVASASFVWINGQKVGYNEGAQEPAEYNISKYLKAGKNTLTVFVVKYSDGYYLEGQDYWRFAGIFDDVWLYATPEVRLFDWQVITDLDQTYTDAKLKINTRIKTYGNSVPTTPYTIKARLYDKDKKIVSEFVSKQFNLDRKDKDILLEQDIKNPLKWTSETPNLYTLNLELITSDDKIQDKAHTRIGFKETEIRGEVFYLNGVPVKINAQNSHMQHPELGHTMDEATIRKDFELLKQFNFNAVRISHYPPVNRYLELADEYGLFIIDEVGNEAHISQWVSTWPEFTEMYRERVQRMVLRDRNYPCILFWSAGNESGEGENITETIREGKKIDPTRYWMYGGNAFSHHAEEIIGPRYPTPLELEVQIGLPSDNPDRRPSFMDEYLSIAGNGAGGLDDYWDIVYAYPRLMGGAIWDYVSPGLTEHIRSLTDVSPNNTPAHLMGNATLVKEGNNMVLDLNGHDQWVEIYRQDNVEITGDKLLLTFRVFPRKLSSDSSIYITKGSNQFGVRQKGKECLEFYLYTNNRHVICAPLPDDWEYKWHDVAALYDGQEMSLYIDKDKKVSAKVSGDIRNLPFPVNIGRNAQIPGAETDIHTCDARLDNVGIFVNEIDINNPDPKKAALWFDFEKEQSHGTFYSYGIGARVYGCIWPDRSVQPEMWQMKKTVQPLAFRMLNAENGTVEVWNRNHFLDAGYYHVNWLLEADGEILQQGKLDVKTPPLSKESIHIPYSKPTIEAGREYRILISAVLQKDELWAPAGHEVAWEQLDLPWRNEPSPKPAYTGQAPTCTESADMIIIAGADFKYSFDKRKGQLTSIIYQGKEMLRSPITLNLWRAPLPNELDRWNANSGRSIHWKEAFGNTIAAEMYSLGIDKMIHQPLTFDVEKNDHEVYVRIKDLNLFGLGEKGKTDLYIEGIRNSGIRNQYEFVISGNGTMTIHHRLRPEGAMPLWFPRVGISAMLDKSLNQVAWYGRGPQENYPDRKTGYKVGRYNSTVQGMYEPYLMPQDYGLRTDNRWVRMTDNDGTGLQVSMNEHFNFSATPYSTDNLTKATYTYQLLEQDGITFNLDYATSGVGCTARAIFSAYRAMPQVYERVITIEPLYSTLHSQK